MRFLLAIILLAFALPALAQDNAEQEKSYFVSFLENQLSTPNRQIRIADIQGVLSSNATIGEITVADRRGVWLRIANASIVWSRSALILRQRLEIDRLTADRIEMTRKPLPRKGLPSPEAGGFSVPQLPIAVDLKKLEAPSVAFGPEVFGLESEMSVEGSLALADGSLDTTLSIERTDGPGGQLSLAANYSNESRVLDLDLSLSEPANGVLANLLNIEGRPPIALSLKGSGPLDRLDLALALEAAGEKAADGALQLRRREHGLGFTAKLSGAIAKLVPERYHAFFGAQTDLAASGTFPDAGGFSLARLHLASAALTLQASAETSPDWFLTGLALDASIAGEDGAVVLPVAGGQTTVQSAKLTLAFGQAGSERWSGRLEITDLTGGGFAAGMVALDMGGAADSLDRPERRHLTFNLDGAVSDIDWKQEKVAEALGDTIRLTAAGGWRAGQAVTLKTAKLEGNGLSLAMSGEIADYAFNGDINLDARSIAPFSALAGRSLSGGMTMKASGRLEPVTGVFDLTLDSQASELRLGRPALNDLLAGTTTISGRLARGEDGLEADNLRVANDQVMLSANGTFATGEADFGFDLTLADLALISDNAQGRLTANGRATGQQGRIALTLTAGVFEGRLAGRTLADASLGFQGTLQNDILEGQMTGRAGLDGVPVHLSSTIALADREWRLSALDFSAGKARLTGDLTRNAEGLFGGDLSVAAPDISTAAALFLTEASGSINADISLSHSQGRQAAKASGTMGNLTMGPTLIGSASFDISLEDLLGVPLANGTISASDAVVGGVGMRRLDAKATRSGSQTTFSADTLLDNGATLSTSGSLAARGGGFSLVLDEAELARSQVEARLLEPATIRVDGRNISFDAIRFDVGGGRLMFRGEVADTYDVGLTIQNLPLAVANSVRPALQLGGTVDGSGTISGPRNAPRIEFDIAGRQVTAAELRRAGLSTVTVTASGSSSNSVLTLDGRATSPEGLEASVEGDVPLDAGELALNVRLDAFPVAVLNTVAREQNLAGNISGSARVTGSLASPRATFSLEGSGLGAAQLARLGVKELKASARGQFADNAIRLSSLEVSGLSGLSLGASGRVPLSGGGLAVDFSGTVPLSLANNLLAARGASAEGSISVDGRATGSLSRPVVNGTFSVANARLVDPQSNVRLNGIRASGSISGDRITIGSASAAFAAGGEVSVSGTVVADARADFPADLKIGLDQARYADGEFVAATVSGALTLKGPLARDPLLSGNINVQRAEIIAPENLGGGTSALDVRHVAPPPAVRRTLKRARAEDGTPMPSARPSVVRLDLTINAPARVFVRGRGLDAELGGSVRVTGPITDLRPVGGFNLIRGRLSILGKRIVFNEGRITLIGDLDPFIDFIARSSATDMTVFITVKGRVSELDISFSSQPELPEDEVLARLIFDRGVEELSPLQLARLAAAAAELAGGSNSSLLNDLRSATGLDELDVVTDSQGNAAVRAGRYIQENVYLGVEAGAQGTTRGTVNIDITDDLRAKGAVDSQGNSSVGIFYEKDY